MAQRPRRGDRQRRQDERNTFLDLLLAARERLILSHSGRSARDNAPRPPSVLVGELFDVLLPARRLGVRGGRRALVPAGGPGGPAAGRPAAPRLPGAARRRPPGRLAVAPGR
ncbi:hypothetical protein ABXN37_08730 [Piscinibacter sakaiensis]|uniref:hypothetical protein n=1 Tax=Piscinibacter sakaiensis TaxID=1547922 RepID=UPI00372869CD